MSKIHIRHYKAEDFDALKDILEEANLFVSSWDNPDRLKKRIEQRSDSIVVAIDEKKVVGCVYILDDVIPFIFRLAVKKEFRKRGIGSLLITEAINRMKKHGHTEISFFVDDKNEELKSWYKKKGFKEASTWLCMWKEI